MAIIKNTPTIVGGSSGGGKTYQLVKKTVRCEIAYNGSIDELQISLPSAMNLSAIQKYSRCVERKQQLFFAVIS